MARGPPVGALAVAPAPVLAQIPATLDVHVTLADGAAPDGALVEVLEADGAGALQSATVPAGGDLVTLHVPFAAAVVRVSKPGFQGAEGRFAVVAGQAVSLAARLVANGAAAGSTVIERDRIAAAREIAIDARVAEALPGGTTLWSLLETVHPFLIADRIDGGGQWPGEPARLGSQQGSPGGQSTFRVDGMDVTDPRIIGAPAVGGDLASVAGIVVQTAAVDPAAAGPGPIVDLLTRRPGSSWSGDLRLLAAPAGLQQKPGDVPPITRLDSGFDASVSAGGAIGTHGVGLFVSGRDAQARRVEREDPDAAEPAVGFGLLHLVAVPNANREIPAVRRGHRRDAAAREPRPLLEPRSERGRLRRRAARQRRAPAQRRAVDARGVVAANRRRRGRRLERDRRRRRTAPRRRAARPRRPVRFARHALGAAGRPRAGGGAVDAPRSRRPRRGDHRSDRRDERGGRAARLPRARERRARACLGRPARPRRVASIGDVRRALRQRLPDAVGPRDADGRGARRLGIADSPTAAPAPSTGSP